MWDVLRAACAKGCLAWWLAHFWDFGFCGILSVRVVCDFVWIKSGYLFSMGTCWVVLWCFAGACLDWCWAGLGLAWCWNEVGEVGYSWQCLGMWMWVLLVCVCVGVCVCVCVRVCVSVTCVKV